MLYALDHGMINGDYVFIMLELDQNQVSLYSKQPFKWLFSSYPSTLSRFHHLRDAFAAVFVLAVKSTSKTSYSKFQAELRNRAHEKPFYSKVYSGHLFGDKKNNFPAKKTEVISRETNHDVIFGIYINVDLFFASPRYTARTSMMLSISLPLHSINHYKRKRTLQERPSTNIYEEYNTTVRMNSIIRCCRST